MRIDNPQLSGSIFATGSTFLTGSVTINDYSLPLLDGIDRQILKTDGLGNITFGYPEDITVTVKNVSGTTLQKGTPVHVTGSTGNSPNVIAASASNAETMPATFVLNETLADEAEGEALIAGFIQEVNTDGFIPGTVVYVGPNGGYTQTRPTGSALIQNLGVIIKAHPTNGSGVVLGAGRSNDVPNILPGHTWVGNSSYRAIATPTSSLSVAFATSASYALSASHEITYEKSSSYADFALTASFALNAGGGAGAGFPFSGSAEITGSLFVSGGNISGSFVGDGAGLTGITINEFATFEDTFTNAPSHSAVHNFNTKNVFVQVFEDDDTLLIPNSVTTTTPNQVDIVFGANLSGRVVIGKAGHLLQDTGNFASSSTAVQTFTNATTASINHGLNSENVITQVFDSNGNVIVPSNIKVANSNTVQLTFASVRSGKAVVAKAGHIVSSTASTELSNNLIPSLDETYDLGSPTKKWKDLYLSGSTIYLGNTKISEKAGGGLSITDASGSEVTSGIAERVRAGDSGSRPTDYENIQTGSLWYNTDTGGLEVYTGVSASWWQSTGTVNTLRPLTPYTASFLVVAGGGGGGGTYVAPGGGAGGLRTSYGATSGGGSSSESNVTFTGGVTYNIIVGAGGAGGPVAGSNGEGSTGTSGNDSSLVGTGITTVTSTGGGGAGAYNGINGSNGGSGGGGAHSTTTDNGGSGTSGQGYDGGSGHTGVPYSGGGGGAAQAGGDASAGSSDGGDGLAVNILSTSNATQSSVGEVNSNNVYFAGGGAGANYVSATPNTVGTGGLGGGGDQSATYAQGNDGGVNTGGGGAGSERGSTGDTKYAGGAGGSGVVILRMSTANYTGTYTGTSVDVYTEGSDTVIVFKSSGTYTA